MNDRFLSDLTATLVNTPISEVTAAVDRNDLQHQALMFIDMVNIETEDRSQRLRHRAEMMRRRANEFDELADNLDKAVHYAISKTDGVLAIVTEIEDLLSRYAHIEPQKVKV